jgi:hypothetical protein
MIKSLEFSGISFAICRNRVEMQAINWLMCIAYDHLYPLKNSLFAQQNLFVFGIGGFAVLSMVSGST